MSVAGSGRMRLEVTGRIPAVSRHTVDREAVDKVKGMYLGNGRVLIGILGDVPLIVPGDDISLTPMLAAKGVVEPGLTKYLINNIKPGMTAVDCGANVGYFSILLGHKVGETGRVYAYEPNPRLAQFLEDNIRANYLKNHVIPIRKAAFSFPTELTFHVSRKYTSYSSLRPFSEQFSPDDETEAITVQTETLDERLSEHRTVDFVKIDVEGAEYQVLLGLKGMIDRGAVDTIAFEYAPTVLRHDTEPMGQFLNSLGSEYDFCYADSDGSLKPLNLEWALKQTFLHSIILKRKPMSGELRF